MNVGDYLDSLGRRPSVHRFYWHSVIGQPTERHGPYCIRCQADRFPTGQREVELHLSPRFGDDRRLVYRYAKPYIGGELSHDVVEVRPGKPGFAVLLEGKTGMCPNCHAIHYPLRFIVRGDIQVRIEDVELEMLPHLWEMPFPAPRLGATLAEVSP